MTSGLIQYGDPILVYFLESVLRSCELTPKSASFTLPSASSSTLAALTSLWSVLASCRVSRPLRTDLQTAEI